MLLANVVRAIAEDDALDWGSLLDMRVVCRAWSLALNDNALDDRKCAAAIAAVRHERRRRMRSFWTASTHGRPLSCDVCQTGNYFPDGTVIVASTYVEHGRFCSTCAETKLLLDAICLQWPGDEVFAHVRWGVNDGVDNWKFSLCEVPVTVADMKHAGIRFGASIQRQTTAVVATQPWATRALLNYPTMTYGSQRRLDVLSLCTK
jgi:hypothetical protein